MHKFSSSSSCEEILPVSSTCLFDNNNTDVLAKDINRNPSWTHLEFDDNYANSLEDDDDDVMLLPRESSEMKKHQLNKRGPGVLSRLTCVNFGTSCSSTTNHQINDKISPVKKNSLMESTKGFNAFFEADIDELSIKSSTHTLSNKAEDVIYDEFIAAPVIVDHESTSAVQHVLPDIAPNVEYNDDTMLLPRGANTVQRSPNRRGKGLLSRISRAKSDQHSDHVAVLKRGTSTVEIVKDYNEFEDIDVSSRSI